MNKELDSVELARIEFEKGLEDDPNNEWLKRLIKGLKIAEQALLELKAIKESNPSEALECLETLGGVCPEEEECIKVIFSEEFNTIKQALLKAQEQEKENAEYKNVLNALKNYLHILPMADGNDVIGIGCPTNEDVIEPNDFGYDIIKDWLKKDNGE